MDRRAARLNRTGLTLLGLVLLAGGGAALARGFGAWGERRASEPVLTDQVRRYATDHGWFWWAVAVAVIVLALLGLAWLFSQGRSHRLSGFSLEPDSSDGRTRLPSRAVSDALEEEIEEFPGVGGARARVLGSTDHPRLHLNVAYSPQADLAELRRRIGDEAVPRLCQALERDSMPTVVRLRLVPVKQSRTVL